VLLVCCLTLLGLCLSTFRAGVAGYVVICDRVEGTSMANIGFGVTGGSEDLHYSNLDIVWY
jgi:hypothetical protein